MPLSAELSKKGKKGNGWAMLCNRVPHHREFQGKRLDFVVFNDFLARRLWGFIHIS